MAKIEREEKGMHMIPEERKKKQRKPEKRRKGEWLQRLQGLELKKPETLRGKSAEGLLKFFCLMLLFTLVSRGASSLTIPQVETERPSAKAISTTVEADGKVEAEGTLPIYTEAGLRVAQIAAKEGAAVEEGDLLFQVDTEDLEELIEEKQTEIKKLDLTLQDLAANQAKADAEKQRTKDRAQQDYEAAKESGEAQVQELREARDAAKQELQDFLNHPEIPEDVEDKDAWKEDKAVELTIAYEEKQRAYEEAKETRDSQVRSAERALEDANQADTADSTAESSKLDRDQLKQELKKLQEVQEASGEIRATAAGIVTQVSVQVGQRTTDSASMLLAEQADSLQFTAQVSKDAELQPKAGMEASVKLSGEREEISVTIDRVTVNDTDPSLYDVYVLLPEGTGQSGDTGTLTLTEKSEKYDTCVPTKALHMDQNQAYVLVTKTVETMMGEELQAERVDVTVIEKNESYAAVEGALSQEDKVIVSGDREVQAGDRIRLAE